MKRMIDCCMAVLLMVLNVCSAETLHIHDRIYGKPIFDKFAPEFARITGFDLEFHLLEFPIFDSAEQALIHGESIDMVAMYAGMVPRYAEAGWLDVIEDEPGLVFAVDRMYANSIMPIRHDGKIYGIGHFSSGVVVPLVDMDKLGELGLRRTDLPQTWNGLSEQLITLAEAGHKGLYFPFWFNDGIGLPIAFSVEVWNRGGSVVDPDQFSVSMVPDSGAAFDTLRDWRRLIDSGAVDRRVLEMDYLESIAAFAAGDHLYSAYTVDALMRSKSSGRKVTIVPRISQPWGAMGSVSYGLVINPNESESRRRAKRKLLQLYTRGADGSEFAVTRALLASAGYFSVYKDYMHGEEAMAIVRSRLSFPKDIAALMDVYDNMQYPVGEWNAVWYVEFNVYMMEVLKAFLLDDSISPSEVIVSLNERLIELRRQYGF